MTAETRKYDLIVAAVESGYADEAMNAAREAGAAGGTLIKAMTLNNRKAEQLIGVTLQQETEILIILTKCEGKLPIMRAIQETAGLKTGRGRRAVFASGRQSDRRRLHVPRYRGRARPRTELFFRSIQPCLRRTENPEGKTRAPREGAGRT